MLAKLSILGLYNYDSTIFDNFNIPAELDKNVLINAIIADCAEFPTAYPNPTIFKQFIATWSKQKLPIWNKLYNTTVLDYNPIENYNRYEDLEENDKRNIISTDNNTTTDRATAFNSSSLATVGDSTLTGNNSTSTNDTITHTNHMHGNIGVTTNQKMISDERNIDLFDIYTAIVGDFKDAFCVQVY